MYGSWEIAEGAISSTQSASFPKLISIDDDGKNEQDASEQWIKAFIPQKNKEEEEKEEQAQKEKSKSCHIILMGQPKLREKVNLIF